MGRDVVSAKLDVIFKKLFTENSDLLHSFVASMLDIPPESIKEITISNPELPPETVASKFSRLDVYLRAKKRRGLRQSQADDHDKYHQFQYV